MVPLLVGRVDMRHKFKAERRPIAVAPLLDGPAARAPAARATRATSDWRVIVARNARLFSTQPRPERPDDTHLPKKHNCQNYFAAPGRAGTSNRSGDTVQLMSHEQSTLMLRPRNCTKLSLALARLRNPHALSVKPDFPGVRVGNLRRSSLWARSLMTRGMLPARGRNGSLVGSTRRR